MLEFKKDTHQYFNDGQQLISVSKILNFYYGDSYDHVPKEILKKAQIRGQAVHKILELYFNYIVQKDVIYQIKEKIKDKFNYKILKYCDTALNMVLEHFNDFSNINYIVEQPIAFDLIAGTPDLLHINSENSTLYDWKTYKSMTKELKLKAELQLTAYWWLLTKNDYKVNNKVYIYWIQQDEWEIIEVTIDENKINEWKYAIHFFLQNHCYNCHVNKNDLIDGLIDIPNNPKIKICADCHKGEK